ncbi:MAG: histidine phosphatase family protein [Alphaproteobacteria bacterium]|nr:histidine phosphatase family protein [Alphaproteobacteria bacterium]
MHLPRRAAAAFPLLFMIARLPGGAAASPAPPSGLDALARGEAIALIRHATAPGIGDPPEMRLDDCASQRNLDEAGRTEARALGARLRQSGISTARIRSSRWCRCRETATLLALGPVVPHPALDSFFASRDLAASRTAALAALVAELGHGPPVILVTHQVNITAFTGIVPAPAEIVIVDRRPPHAVRETLR